MIKLRLRRMGAKRRPSYRIVAAESSSPRDGRFIESVGHYDPLTDPATIKIDEERVRHWLSNGAQPTETVASIFKRHGITRGKWPNTSQTERASTAVEGESPVVAAPAAPTKVTRARRPAAATTTSS
ncbi:MAG: SSU ribosomal protein S16p [uncultured Thermomicrobiales bacterium]|uniref:Small ribosomal subunit protein bS16 n=1 Tax=uncultured Thermomicrobiales bacterium TaxID=1645740 RepID=A0A6J4V9H7_9BACT|nr:MAG: SSU ribosomal protein S16p [uncultured Thermomicrobiales bacterium]